MSTRLQKSYKAAGKGYKYYWRIYGGWRALAASPYFAIAMLVTLACAPMWMRAGREDPWYDLALNILPSMLGFTLGGYAILLAFGDERFRKLISGPDEDGKDSPFMRVNGLFIHFIVVQGLGAIIALIGKAWEIDCGVGAFVGVLFIAYSVCSGVAAGMAVMNVAEWYDMYLANVEDDDQNPDDPKS